MKKRSSECYVLRCTKYRYIIIRHIIIKCFILNLAKKKMKIICWTLLKFNL